MNKFLEIGKWLKDWSTNKSRVGIPRNGWFGVEGMEIYLRVHKLENIPTIDIATITIEKSLRGKGQFTEFLDWLIPFAKTYKFERIKAENVLDPRFRAFFLRRGFKQRCNQSAPDEISPSYYLKLL